MVRNHVIVEESHFVVTDICRHASDHFTVHGLNTRAEICMSLRRSILRIAHKFIRTGRVGE